MTKKGWVGGQGPQIVNFYERGSWEMVKVTKDGSVNANPQILNGQYLILGGFGSYMN